MTHRQPTAEIADAIPTPVELDEAIDAIAAPLPDTPTTRVANPTAPLAEYEAKSIRAHTLGAAFYAQILGTGNITYRLPGGRLVGIGDPAVMRHAITLADRFLAVVMAAEGAVEA
jgi:hypothetical protein